jgi:hypothetical protein
LEEAQEAAITPEARARLSVPPTKIKEEGVTTYKVAEVKAKEVEIRDELEATKKEHEKEVKVLMKPFENNTDIKEIQIDNSEITTTIKNKSSNKNIESIDNYFVKN